MDTKKVELISYLVVGWVALIPVWVVCWRAVNSSSSVVTGNILYYFPIGIAVLMTIMTIISVYVFSKMKR